MWVLIALAIGSGPGSSTFPAWINQEFTSQERCEDAAKSVVAMSRFKGINLNYSCVPK